MVGVPPTWTNGRRNHCQRRWTGCESGTAPTSWPSTGLLTVSAIADDCQCMEDMEDGDIRLITRSDVAVLPDACVSACPAEETAYVECRGGGYFLATGGQSCDDACASAGGCDLAAITFAAWSVEACKRVLDYLGVSYGVSGDYTSPGDTSGCTYHPDQTGWAQLNGYNPTCGRVNSDPSRQRVCACNGGGGGGDDDYDVDDDFAPNTCDDVQQCLVEGRVPMGPPSAGLSMMHLSSALRGRSPELPRLRAISCSAPTCLGGRRRDWDGSPCAVVVATSTVFVRVLREAFRTRTTATGVSRRGDCKRAAHWETEKSNRDNAMCSSSPSSQQVGLLLLDLCRVNTRRGAALASWLAKKRTRPARRAVVVCGVGTGSFGGGGILLPPPMSPGSNPKKRRSAAGREPARPPGTAAAVADQDSEHFRRNAELRAPALPHRHLYQSRHTRSGHTPAAKYPSPP